MGEKKPTNFVTRNVRSVLSESKGERHRKTAEFSCRGVNIIYIWLLKLLLFIFHLFNYVL